MPQYTVLGYYDDDAQTYAHTVDATDALDAMAQCGRAMQCETLVIIGAIEGEHALETPSDENSRTAYATDLAGMGAPQGHEWRRSRFAGNTTCARCGLMPLDDDDLETPCDPAR